MYSIKVLKLHFKNPKLLGLILYYILVIKVKIKKRSILEMQNKATAEEYEKVIKIRLLHPLGLLIGIGIILYTTMLSGISEAYLVGKETFVLW